MKKKIKKTLSLIRRTILYYVIWPHYFRKYSKQPIDEKKVVFAYADTFKKIPDNLRCMKKYLESKGYNCVAIEHAENDPAARHGFFGRLLGLKVCEDFFREYCTAKALFLNEFYFPAYACKPREGQRVVQLWHACGAFKKWGYSTADKSWGASRKELQRFPIHNTYTDVCVSSPKVSFAYAEAFQCPESIVKPLGVPRTDVFFDPNFVAASRQILLKRFPRIGSRKIILYAPTFRGNSILESYNENKLDFIKMKEALGDEYVLVLKLHPRTAKAFRIPSHVKEIVGDFVFNATRSVEIDTALCAADIVISDYSSLVFEYSLLERPMLFFAYDLKEYDDARSFYFKYEDFVPGPIVTDTKQIIRAIQNVETACDLDKVRRFKADYMSACDGHSLERIAHDVLGV
ncbi:MAG: CDP-glycerol glycerophosphotransferase family protein [Clostridia bacterium]|nr:CDP-glycerol glycerophosphotransferase family protein [Clostridia bacterium]